MEKTILLFIYVGYIRYCKNIVLIVFFHNQNIVLLLELYPKLPKVLKLYPFYGYQGEPDRPYLYFRCLLNEEKRDSNIRYLFHLYKIKQGQDGRLSESVVRRSESPRNYLDVLFTPESNTVGLGDTVK